MKIVACKVFASNKQGLLFFYQLFGHRKLIGLDLNHINSRIEISEVNFGEIISNPFYTFSQQAVYFNTGNRDS